MLLEHVPSLADVDQLGECEDLSASSAPFTDYFQDSGCLQLPQKAHDHRLTRHSRLPVEVRGLKHGALEQEIEHGDSELGMR